jgi:hypothetical protein
LETALATIKKNLSVPKWVLDKREEHKILDALLTGNDYNNVLISRIEQIENTQKAIARKKYSKDIRDLFSRILQPRVNVFTASGGSYYNEIPSNQLKDKFDKHFKDFKGQKSVKEYLKDNLFHISDIDPNALIFVEYKEDQEIYPTYKSIKHIRNYESNGQLLKWVLFEPVNIEIGSINIKKWRYVDSEMDITIIQNGETFTLSDDDSFAHPFGVVPAVIVSRLQEIGTEKRLSTINEITELAKDYAAFKSVATVMRYTNGMPFFWMYDRFCPSCRGTGKDMTTKKVCGSCNGSGQLIKRDITDVHIIDLPRDKEDAIVTPNLMGYVSPDLDTLKYYDENAADREQQMEATVWGTQRVLQTGTKNETATGRFIDTQPIITKLYDHKSTAEFVDNFLIDMIVNWTYGTKQNDSLVNEIFGDRFIIESQDVLIDKYATAKEKGLNATILDKMLEEYIYSKFGSNQKLLNEQLKKKEVEPYIHYSIQEVFDIFGIKEASKKAQFVDFWEVAEKDKEVEQLKKEFINFIKPIENDTTGTTIV